MDAKCRADVAAIMKAQDEYFKNKQQIQQ
jgi:hypothetical protein